MLSFCQVIMHAPIQSVISLLYISLAVNAVSIPKNRKTYEQALLAVNPQHFDAKSRQDVLTDLKTGMRTKHQVEKHSTSSAQTSAHSPTSSKLTPTIHVTYGNGISDENNLRGKKACSNCGKCRRHYDCAHDNALCNHSCEVSRNCIDCNLWEEAVKSKLFDVDVDIVVPADWSIDVEISEDGAVEVRPIHGGI